MDKKLLEILVCPICKGSLAYQKQPPALICKAEGLLYPVRDGIPCLIVDEAVNWEENP